MLPRARGLLHAPQAAAMRALSKDPQSRRQPQVQPPCSDGAAAAAGTRQHVAAAATTDIDSSILRRLEVLERQVGALLAASAQRRHCNAGARGSDDHNGSGSESSSTGSSSSSKPRGEQHARGEQQQAQASGVVGRVAGAMEEAASDAVERLHPAFVQFLNSGYMESQRQLRDRLLSSEWDGTVRTWALRKGVADFERWVAEHGGEAGVELRWDVVQRLYERPDDFSVLADQPKAQLLAQSFVTQAAFSSRLEVYKACTDTAKQLANVIESGQRTGASTLLGLLRKVLRL